jgi:hypothetical protein
LPRRVAVSSLMAYDACAMKKSISINNGHRKWTATEIKKIRGLIKLQASPSRIVRMLGRTSKDIQLKADALGISIDVHEDHP